MEPYATDTDLEAYLSATDWATVEAGEDSPRLLARASNLMDAVIRAPFAIDDDGLPTDERIAAALRDAVCAQIEAWLEVGESNDVDGLASSAVSVTGFSGPRAPRIAPRAADALRTIGLTRLPTITDVYR